ncbi:hypothetical protein ACOSQ3_027455 [Xanthoceras sorbifolium]
MKKPLGYSLRNPGISTIDSNKQQKLVKGSSASGNTAAPNSVLAVGTMVSAEPDRKNSSATLRQQLRAVVKGKAKIQGDTPDSMHLNHETIAKDFGI